MIFSPISLTSLAILTLINSTMACVPPKIGTLEYLDHVKDKYLNIWNGDLSLINSTFAPTLSFHADRFPSSNGSEAFSITTRQEFRSFVERSRTGWDEYEFTVHAWTGNENCVAVRWVLNGVIGANFTIVPTPLQQGDSVTYNGTDFLILDKETGLIEELAIAQDLISLFHNLGLTAVTV